MSFWEIFWFAFLGGFALFLWTVVVGFFCYRAGEENEKTRQGDESAPVSVTVAGPAVTEDDLHMLIERIELIDRQVQRLDDLQENAPADVSMGAQRRLEMIEPLEGRISMLEETVSGFRDRFTRVERKAGMRV